MATFAEAALPAPPRSEERHLPVVWVGRADDVGEAYVAQGDAPYRAARPAGLGAAATT